MTFLEKASAVCFAKSDEEMREAISKLTDLQKETMIVALINMIKKQNLGFETRTFDISE